MSDNITQALVQFKVIAAQLLKSETAATPSTEDVDTLTASFLAALYSLNEGLPRATEITSSLVVGFPRKKPWPMQKFNLEIPRSLHTTIKTGCILRRTTMNSEILALIEAHYLGSSFNSTAIAMND